MLWFTHKCSRSKEDLSAKRSVESSPSINFRVYTVAPSKCEELSTAKNSSRQTEYDLTISPLPCKKKKRKILMKSLSKNGMPQIIRTFSEIRSCSILQKHKSVSICWTFSKKGQFSFVSQQPPNFWLRCSTNLYGILHSLGQLFGLGSAGQFRL